MNKIKHLRLSGHSDVVALTTEANDRFLYYLTSARQALAGDPDADETLRDLEEALGHRMHRLVLETGVPLDDQQMRQLLEQAGEVESPTGVDDEARGVSRGRFWCRIQDGKWFGGLCLGIAARGHFRVDWVRTVVLLVSLFTGGLLALVYLALLLVLPPVASVEEYERLSREPRTG